jgi:hypothetical protein
MFITNHESLNKENLYPCKSKNLKTFLCEHKSLNFISMESFVEEKEGKQMTKYVWFFVKTPELQEGLKEWTMRKSEGNMLFPK